MAGFGASVDGLGRLTDVSIDFFSLSVNDALDLVYNAPHPEEVHHGTESERQKHFNDKDGLVPGERFFLEIIDQLWVAVAKENTDLEN